MNTIAKIEDIKLADVLPTKFGLELIADTIKEQVNNGEIDPLVVAIKMNAIEQLAKLTKERIMDSVMTELGKYPKGNAEVLGAKVSVMDSIKYDFSHLNGWQELEDQITALKEKQKDIEDHEKTYFKGNLPVKSATSTFKIVLAK